MDARKKKQTGLKGKGTLIAVGLLVALGAWSWFFERGEVREPGQTPPVSELVGMKSDDVTRVELLQNGPSILLTRNSSAPTSQGGVGMWSRILRFLGIQKSSAPSSQPGARAGTGAAGGWQMQKPIQARADDAQVKQMLDGLLNATIDQTLAEQPKDFKEYGLDKPALQVTLTDAKGHQKVLQTGVKDIRGSSVYARTTDSPQLFLLSSYSVDDLAKKKADDLRDKTALALDPNSVNQLSFQLPAQTTRVERQGAKWQMTAPYAAPADTDTVSLVLNQIKDLKVDHFDGNGANLKADGLAPPKLTVTVRGPAGEKGLLLGKATASGKDVYAMHQGETEVFELPKNTLDDFSKKPGDLRDKTLLSFKRDDASRIAITTPGRVPSASRLMREAPDAGGTLELTHTGKEWNITKPALGKPKDDRLSTLLFTLEMVKGSRVVAEKPASLAPYGLDKPQLQVDVTLPKGAQELQIGKKAGANDYYARSSSQAAIFTVPDFTVTDLKIKPTDLAAPPPAKSIKK